MYIFEYARSVFQSCFFNNFIIIDKKPIVKISIFLKKNVFSILHCKLIFFIYPCPLTFYYPPPTVGVFPITTFSHILFRFLLYHSQTPSISWSSGWSAVIMIDMVSGQNLFVPFCFAFGKDTLQHFPLHGDLGKQF